MRRHGLAGPDRADFLGSVVADGEDEVQFGRAGTGEFLPSFTAQACDRVGVPSQADAGLLVEPLPRDGFQRYRR